MVLFYVTNAFEVDSINGRMVNALVCCPTVPGSNPSLGKTQTLKIVIHTRHSYIHTPRSMSQLNYEIYQHWRVSRVPCQTLSYDTELILQIAHLNPTIRLNSWWSVVGRVRCNQTKIKCNSRVQQRTAISLEVISCCLFLIKYQKVFSLSSFMRIHLIRYILNVTGLFAHGQFAQIGPSKIRLG